MDVSQLNLRIALGADASRIALMSRDLIEHGLGWSWTEPRVAKNIACHDTNVLVACTGTQLIGFGIMHVGDSDAHLNLLAIRPSYQRRGLGTRIVDWLEKSARTAGISRVTLEVRSTNEQARHFYSKLGYSEGAHIDGYYGNTETAIRMTHVIGISAK